MKNYMNKISKGIFNPLWAVRRLLEKPYLNRYRTLKRETLYEFKSNLLSLEYDDYNEIISEIFSDEKLISEVEANIESSKNLGNIMSRDSFPHEEYSWPTFIYYFVRKSKPETIVETGCFSGISTIYILAALKKNKKGKLYTIDKPAFEDEYTENPYLEDDKRFFSLPKGHQPGYLIPEYLKDKWELILGISEEKLPPLLKELNSVDIFLHDSLHTYENMFFEFETAIKHLASDGVIFADNINWNNSFYDFSSKYKLKSYTYIAYYDSRKNLRVFKRGSTKGHNFGAILK